MSYGLPNKLLEVREPPNSTLAKLQFGFSSAIDVYLFLFVIHRVGDDLRLPPFLN